MTNIGKHLYCLFFCILIAVKCPPSRVDAVEIGHKRTAPTTERSEPPFWSYRDVISSPETTKSSSSGTESGERPRKFHENPPFVKRKTESFLQPIGYGRDVIDDVTITSSNKRHKQNAVEEHDDIRGFEKHPNQSFAMHQPIISEEKGRLPSGTVQSAAGSLSPNLPQIVPYGGEHETKEAMHQENPIYGLSHNIVGKQQSIEQNIHSETDQNQCEIDTAVQMMLLQKLEWLKKREGEKLLQELEENKQKQQQKHKLWLQQIRQQMRQSEAKHVARNLDSLNLLKENDSNPLQKHTFQPEHSFHAYENHSTQFHEPFMPQNSLASKQFVNAGDTSGVPLNTVQTNILDPSADPLMIDAKIHSTHVNNFDPDRPGNLIQQMHSIQKKYPLLKELMRSQEGQELISPLSPTQLLQKHWLRDFQRQMHQQMEKQKNEEHQQQFSMQMAKQSSQKKKSISRNPHDIRKRQKMVQRVDLGPVEHSSHVLNHSYGRSTQIQSPTTTQNPPVGQQFGLVTNTGGKFSLFDSSMSMGALTNAANTHQSSPVYISNLEQHHNAQHTQEMLAQMLFSRKKYSLLRELMQAKIGSEEKSSPSSLQLLQQNALFQQMQQRHQNIGNQSPQEHSASAQAHPSSSTDLKGKGKMLQDDRVKSQFPDIVNRNNIGSAHTIDLIPFSKTAHIQGNRHNQAHYEEEQQELVHRFGDGNTGLRQLGWNSPVNYKQANKTIDNKTIMNSAVHDSKDVHQWFFFVSSKIDGDCIAYCWRCSRMLRMGEKANLLLHLGWHRDEITLSELSQQDFGEYLYVPEQLKQSLQEQAHLSQCQ